MWHNNASTFGTSGVHVANPLGGTLTLQAAPKKGAAGRVAARSRTAGWRSAQQQQQRQPLGTVGKMAVDGG